MAAPPPPPPPAQPAAGATAEADAPSATAAASVAAPSAHGEEVTVTGASGDAERRAAAEVERAVHAAAAAQGSADEAVDAEALRREGNDHFVAKRFKEAEAAYTRALAAAPTNHMLYGNRSAARHAQGAFAAALDDANMAVRVAPRWVKGYHRQACALASLGRLREAAQAYGAGAAVERPPPAWLRAQLAKALAAADAADRQRPVAGGVSGWIGVFRHIRDIRLRLASLAHFWNAASKPVRFAVFRRFFELVSPGDSADAIVAKFTADQMRDLPMDNYADITLPEPWLAFFREQGEEAQAECFAGMWAACTAQEHDLIIKDITHFFNPGGAPAPAAGDGAGAAAAGARGKRRKKRGAKKGRSGAGGSSASASAAAGAAGAASAGGAGGAAAPSADADDVGAGGGAAPGSR